MLNFQAAADLKATNVGALLGDEIAVTGIFNIQHIVETGIPIVVGIAILFAGRSLIKRLLRNKTYSVDMSNPSFKRKKRRKQYR